MKIPEKYIVRDTIELHEKLQGRQNCTLFVPYPIEILSYHEDHIYMEKNNVKLKRLED